MKHTQFLTIFDLVQGNGKDWCNGDCQPVYSFGTYLGCRWVRNAYSLEGNVYSPSDPLVTPRRKRNAYQIFVSKENLQRQNTRAVFQCLGLVLDICPRQQVYTLLIEELYCMPYVIYGGESWYSEDSN